MVSACKVVICRLLFAGSVKVSLSTIEDAVAL